MHAYSGYSPIPTSWIGDYGANNHVTYDLSALNNLAPYSGSDNFYVGDGTSLLISNIGSIMLSNVITSDYVLRNVLYVPTISQNLLSVYWFVCDNNCVLIFTSTGFLVKDSTIERILYQDPVKNGLYLFEACSTTTLIACLATKAPLALRWSSLSSYHD
ncbi:unnamed protein product [Prunus armeniaca]|uniref:Retrovirus-related Pol polyprotein from transposon TNT 1-94-like beta-barrel domain-containing protein n=1 Tax=Prunus armeniaca TaxID=36596 RepID=A0A6J5XD19_PRUAR|nr:unnamed protein product [Prunus armeniaca]